MLIFLYKKLETKKLKNMTQHLQKLHLYRYYFYIIISLIYFWYYFSSYNYQIDIFKDTFDNWKIIIDYLNWFIAFIFVVWALWILNSYLRKLIKRLHLDETNNDKLLGYLLDFINTNKYFIEFYVFFIFIDINEVIVNYVNKTFYITLF